MGEDSYEMRMGKMSKHDTMIDRRGGYGGGGGEQCERNPDGRN